MAQLRAKASVKIFNSEKTAYLGKTFWTDSRLLGCAVLETTDLDFGFSRFSSPVQYNGVKKRCPIRVDQLSDITEKFRGKPTPDLFYFLGPANVGRLLARELKMDPTSLIQLGMLPTKSEDAKIHVMCNSRLDMAEYTKWAMELLQLMAHVRNVLPHLRTELDYNQRLIETNTLYAALVRIDTFSFFSVGVFVLDQEQPTSSLPFHQISLYLLALMGLTPRPVVNFIPTVDGATRENLEQNATVRTFWPPFDDVLHGAASPLTIITASDVIQGASQDLALPRNPKLATLLSTPSLTVTTAQTPNAVSPVTVCDKTTRCSSDTLLPAAISDYILENDAPRARPAAVKPAKIMRFSTDDKTESNSDEPDEAPKEASTQRNDETATQSSVEPDSQALMQDFITEYSAADLAIMEEAPEENFNIMLAADDDEDMTQFDALLAAVEAKWNNA